MRKIILARSLCSNPRLLLLDDFLLGVERAEKERVISHIVGLQRKWTIVFVSNDPFIMQKCERLLVLRDGRTVAEGNWATMQDNVELKELLHLQS